MFDQRINESTGLFPHTSMKQRSTLKSTKYLRWAMFAFIFGACVIIKTSNNIQTSIKMDIKQSSTQSLAFPGQLDLVNSLPGLPNNIHENMYSGYLTLHNGAKLHYFFVESQTKPLEDPIVLWLNGGPGASSLFAALYENGPLTIEDDGTLHRNPNSWNEHANMLYFESPIGVGFSYNISGIYESNDFLQAEDNYEALKLFFRKFPHLQSNEFHVSGESYGGVYVPTLAKAIVDGNQKMKQNNGTLVNLKSFAVGNGVNEYSASSQLFFAYYHGLIGGEMWKSVREACPKLNEFMKPSFSFFDIATNDNVNTKCGNARLKAFASMMSSHINSYNIYGQCYQGDPNYGIDKLMKELFHHSNVTNTPAIAQPIGVPLTLCLNSTAGNEYFNRYDVKEALHIPKELVWSDIAMTNISVSGFKALNITIERPILNYGMPLRGHVIDIWKYLLKHQIRGVIYHGDVDFMCDFIGGQWAVDSLGLPIKSPYQVWTTPVNGIPQAAGFYKSFEGLSFVTIKGAGHMAPQWKPVETKHMFENLIIQRYSKNPTL